MVTKKAAAIQKRGGRGKGKKGKKGMEALAAWDASVYSEPGLEYLPLLMMQNDMIIRRTLDYYHF